MRLMVTAHLRQNGFVVDPVASGEDALLAIRRWHYDAVVLDLGLPGIDGMAVLRRVRGEIRSAVPILVLTARDAVPDRVGGLDAGADDYVLKPFNLEEFDARLRAVMRRNVPLRPALLQCGRLTLDPWVREASVEGNRLELTRRELGLLEELMRGAGRTVVRDRLEDQLYGFEEPVSGNALEATVSRLRRRLATASSDVSILTVRGIGYRLTVHDPS